MFFRTAWLVLRKDIAIEAKSWEVLTTTLFFAVSCVLIFSFAFVKEGRPVEDAAAGILWIAIAFSGTLALGRTFERERYGETLRALLLAPAPRAGDLRRQAARHAGAARPGRSCCWCRWWRCCFRRRCSAGRCCWSALLGRRHDRLLRGRDAVRGDAGAGAHARRAAADPVVSDHHSGDHCGRSRHGGAAAAPRRTSRSRSCGSACWPPSTSCS